MTRRSGVNALLSLVLALLAAVGAIQAAATSTFSDPVAPQLSSSNALNATDQALLLASAPDGIAYLSYGNNSLTLQSAAALVLNQNFLLTLVDWLPNDTSTVTRAWAGLSSANVKKVWLEREFNSDDSSSNSSFALIELADILRTTPAAAVVTASIATGHVAGTFRLLYADPFLLELSQAEHFGWKVSLTSETCVPATADQLCAKPADPVKATVLDMAPRMGFLVEAISDWRIGYAIGFESAVVKSGSQGVKTFLLPGQSRHWAFIKSVMGVTAVAKTTGYTVTPVVLVSTPDFVSLYENSSLVEMSCGGLMVTRYFILLTASCVQGRNVTHVSAYAVRYAVANVIIHPLFKESSDSIYDFALLEIKTGMSAGIKPLHDTIERMVGTTLIRMELGGAKNADYVQKLSSDLCDASAGLDRFTNLSRAGPEKQCVAETTPSQANPRKSAALFFKDGSIFTFVGFQLHPHESNRFISVLDGLNFIRGYAHNGFPKKGDLGYELPVPQRYRVELRIAQKGQNFCGGVLIAPTYVLTAAHCVSDGVVNWIAVGSGAVESYAIETIRVVPNSIVLHPSFGKPYTYSNDAAIFQVMASPIAQPIILDTSLDFIKRPSASLYRFFLPSEMNQVQLLSLAVWSRKECTSKYPYVDASVLCAGGAAKVDACQGDSGSPLTVADSSGKVTLIGLVSSGFQCGLTGVPGFYTRVATLTSFIEQNVVKATWNGPIANSALDDGSNLPALVVVNSPTPSSGQVITSAPTSSSTRLVITIAPTESPVNSPTVEALSSTNTTASKQPVPPNPIDEKPLDGLSSITQSKVVGQLVGGSDATISKGLHDQLVNPGNQVTFYSSGSMDAVLSVIGKHDALPLNQRTDRFDTAGAPAAAVKSEVQVCAV